MDLYGDPTFLDVFDAEFPDPSQRRATSRPAGITDEPTGPELWAR